MGFVAGCGCGGDRFCGFFFFFPPTGSDGDRGSVMVVCGLVIYRFSFLFTSGSWWW